MSFASLLEQPMDTFVAPKPIPAGFYQCIITGYELRESREKKTPGVEFTVIPQAPYSDVDEDELEAAGGLEGSKLRFTFWITPDSAFRLKEFAQNALEVPTEGLSMAETIEACQQIPFIAQVTHRTDPKDASKIYSEIGQTAKFA